MSSHSFASTSSALVLCVLAVASLSTPSTHGFQEDPSASQAESTSGQDTGEEVTRWETSRGAEPDLSKERALLAQFRAALERSDHQAARAHAAQAVSSLLAHPEAARDEAWTRLLDSAARAASVTQDASTAKEAWQEALDVRERTLSEDHPDLLAARENLAMTLASLGDSHGARALFEVVLEACERTLPEDHPILLRVQGNLAATMTQLGDLAEARALQESVLAAFERTLPEHHPDLLRARLNLAVTIKRLGDLHGARALFEPLLEAFERAVPGDHPHLLVARLNLATTLGELGESQAARALFEGVLEVFERTLPEDHPDLVRARQHLATTIKQLGDLHGARALEEAVLEARERTHPEDHPDLLRARATLALTMHSLGHFAAARALQERVLAHRERTLPADHPHLLDARANLARTLSSLGDLHGARALEEAVLDARGRTLPKDHPDLIRAKANLAVTLAQFGDLAGARALEEAVLEARERTLPEDHPDLLAARGNLAATIKDLGDLHGARALEEAVLEARERALPEEHPDLLVARGNLAETMLWLGDLHGARALFRAVLEAFERALPEDHPNLLAVRSGLAGTMYMLGDFAGARALYERVLEACERTLPEGHPGLLRARQNLAWILARAGAIGREKSEGTGEGEWPRALALTREVARGQTRALRGTLLGASAREAEERVVRGSERTLTGALSFAAGLGTFEPEDGLLEEAFAFSESSRGAGLLSAALARGGAEGGEAARLREEIRAASAELAELARRGAAREEYHRARGRREAAERELLRLAKDGLGARSAILDVTAEELAGVLEEGRALVGYRRYTKRWLELEEAEGEDGQTGVRGRSRDSLGAFVLAPSEGEAEPRLAFVDLGPSSSIEELVIGWREAIRAAPERGIALDGAETDPTLERGDRLRRAVWDPLLEHLEAAERVVVTLDDILHLVPLDALPLEGGAELVGERWQIETRVALWELLDAPPPLTGGAALVSLGGASFNSAPLGLEAEELAALEPEQDEPVPSTATRPIALLRGGAWERGFAPLHYTRTEAHGLAELFHEAFEGAAPSLVLDRRRASRAALEQAAPLARFLHVATHGWFAPESVRSWEDVELETRAQDPRLRTGAEETVRGMSPMLLCGLALAGANLPADSLGRVPGLMTAEELSGLDLTGCELAVLSACDTNVGERRAGQGVASLQKALHMAGARSVITSLWKVPDEATAELMLDFYRRLWVEQKPKHQALWEAKLRLRNARDERGHPLYTTRDWAAWVLTGDPD